MTTWSCRDCHFRDPDKRPEYQGAGECRANPPVPMLVTNLNGDTCYEQHWPWMAAHDWCGRWESSKIISHEKLPKPETNHDAR